MPAPESLRQMHASGKSSVITNGDVTMADSSGGISPPCVAETLLTRYGIKSQYGWRTQ
jgi:hypothetical protein